MRATAGLTILGVPSRETFCQYLKTLPAHFEAEQIHVAGLIVASYSGEDYSNWLADSSLGSWLKEQGIPAAYGLDTRALTKKIREKGSMLSKLRQSDVSSKDAIVPVPLDKFEPVEWKDPNVINLVAEGERSRLGCKDPD